MVNLFSSFNKIKRQKILVIGDLGLDTYTIGEAKRISPEAPVAVLQVHREEKRAGMAGNVLLNLISLGADVAAIGRVGQDAAGSFLIESLASEGVDTSGIFFDAAFPTPLKNRVIADSQQLVRVDKEKIVPLSEMLEQKVIEEFQRLLEGTSLIAVSDYGKGFVTNTLMGAVVESAKQKGIAVIVDPKGMDFTKYRDVDLIKPNVKEVYAAANLSLDAPLEKAAQKVLEASRAKALMVTRSEEGISLFYNNGKREDFPVRVKEVKDVTGAGDTVLAMLTAALANGLTISEGAELSNIAAGIAIEYFGCARISLSELARRLLSDDAGNKVFDEAHFFALQEAVKGRRCALLSLNSKEGFSTQLFSSIRQLSQRENWDLLVFVKDLDPNEDFIDILASLHDVDYIIVKSESLKSLYKWIKPEEVYLFEEQELKKEGSWLELHSK